jgi:heat shock protein 1/8
MTDTPDTENLIKQYFETGNFVSIIEQHTNRIIHESDVVTDTKELIVPDKQESQDIIVGIDLGTTNSLIAVWRNNNLEIIQDENGNNSIPSIVAFTNRSRYIGQDAKNQKELNPKNVYYEVKRLIGRKINDVSVINDMEFLSYDIVGDTDNQDNIIIKSDESINKTFTPEEISSMILSKLKLMASRYLKQEVTKAVITVPAYFNDAQRQATKDAAKIANLECVRIINEPTSAALAYGLMTLSVKKNKEKELNVIVYDLGGGTLDVSLLTISEGLFEVKASVGNSHLGGSDYDTRLISYAINYFKKQHNIASMKDLSSLSLQKLRKSCENAKILLSSSVKATIAVQNFYNDKDLFMNITRDTYNKICRDLLILCIKPLEDVLHSCSMNKEDIHEVILVGGMTRMPAIRENIQRFFNKEPNCSINPDEAVVAGAAIQAYILSHQEDPFSESVTLLDIIPLSLGVETIGGVMNVLIPRNTSIPFSKKKMYTTDTDYVDSILVKIYEGERKMTKDNFFIGEFELGNLDKVQRCIPRIEVKFSVDINGIITVTAEDTDKQNKKGITITGNKGRLKNDDIKQLIEDAKKYELEDKIDRNKKELYYEIEDLCSNVKENLKRQELKMSEIDKKLITEDIKIIDNWLSNKKYYDREENELEDIIIRIKKRYGTLILRINAKEANNNVKSKSNNANQNSTSVYGNEDDSDNEEEEAKQVFEKIEIEDLGLDKFNETERQEIKQMRTNLIELCNSVDQILLSPNLKFSDEHRHELRYYIDDILLWVHVHEKSTKLDYKTKIDELNEACDKVIKEYSDVSGGIFQYSELINSIKTSRDELEQLCYTLKSSIICNAFSIKEEKIKELEKELDSILDWLIDVDAEKHKNTNYIEPEDEYKLKLNKLNDMCTDLYNSMIGINIDQTTNILGQLRE